MVIYSSNITHTSLSSLYIPGPHLSLITTWTNYYDQGRRIRVHGAEKG